VYTTTATVTLDAAGDGASVAPAAFTVALTDNDGDGRHYLSAPVLSDFRVGLTAGATAHPPVFFPTPTTPLDPAHPHVDFNIPVLTDFFQGRPQAVTASMPSFSQVIS